MLILIFKITSIFKQPHFREIMHFYVPGAIAGIIIFQVAIIAPTLSKKLAANEFGKVIRGLWPKFFIFIAVLSATSLAIMALTGDGGNYHLAISGFTFLASSICYLIIPATILGASLCLGMMWTGFKFSRLEGSILIGFYLMFLLLIELQRQGYLTI